MKVLIDSQYHEIDVNIRKDSSREMSVKYVKRDNTHRYRSAYFVQRGRPHRSTSQSNLPDDHLRSRLFGSITLYLKLGE